MFLAVAFAGKVSALNTLALRLHVFSILILSLVNPTTINLVRALPVFRCLPNSFALAHKQVLSGHTHYLGHQVIVEIVNGGLLAAGRTPLRLAYILRQVMSSLERV